MATTAAVLGNARLNNFRLNYLPAPVKPLRKTRVFLWINGVPVCYRRGSMTIRDALNDVPNTCTFELFAPTPAPQSGARVRVTIDSDVQRQIFVGAIQTDRVTFAGQAQHDVHPYTAIDDTWLANRRRPFGVWPNVSASTIVTDLVQLWAAPFTATHVQAGLPPVS
ncbi:MAG TPA: hypothetical protein VE200_07575, partial [Xanthobacteraceae bacterium]|nr:hypothetical protein [Xanthobacteraceae bacterium]